jgi:hypothetical protein
LTRLNKNMRKPIFIILIVLGFVLPVLAYAALVPCGRCCQEWEDDARTICAVPCEGVSDAEAQPCTFCDIFRMLQIVINYIWWILLIIAPLFIIAGGVMILTAGVKPDQLEAGKKIITGTIVGLAIAFLSWTVLNIVFITLAKTPGGTGEEAGFPWPWNEVRCTGGAIKEQQEPLRCTSDGDCPVGETCNTSTGVCGEETGINLNTYCHLQIANALDQMVYNYNTAQECYTECPPHCVGPGINCEAWCCLSQNLNSSNNVCTIAGDNWCARPAPAGSNSWILNPPPGGADDRQKGDASTMLTSLLNCMYGRIATLSINSISDNALCASIPTCNPGTGNGCVHTNGSCHYGGPANGPCFGYSFAVDFHTNVPCIDVQDAALACQTAAGGIVGIIPEGNHYHVSINRAGCGCPEPSGSRCTP